MGAERARRWKLFPSFRSLSLPPASPSKPKRRPPPPPDAPLPPSSPAARKEVKEEEEEEIPAEFLCPILRAPMADPVILPSGRTYERACVRACADLGLSLAAEGNAPGGGGVAVAIPNDALRAAVRTWCARSGRAPPVPPSDETAREAVLRAVPAAPRPPERAASNLSSCSSEPVLAPARSASNLSSCSSEAASTSSSSSSSGRSSREMAAGEVEVARGKAAAKDKEEVPPARVADAEEDAVVRAVEAGHEAEVLEAAMSALRRATRESPARRRALCASPRLLASLRRVLLSSSRRHTPSARADAAAALANLTLEPENRVPLVRAGAVPALVDAVASSSSSSAAASSPEAREHAAGALFGLALHEGNRAAIGVLGAVPPLLAVLSDHELATRARRDAGMALYHLSLAAVNQSKLARAPGASRSLLAVASEAGESALIRRLALMVACNVAGCAEGRAALMDAGAVAAASAILSAGDGSELKEWCVAAMYAMSKGSQRFRGVARAAGADRPLMLFAEQASPGVHKEMAETALRTILGLADNRDDDDQITECGNSDGNRGGGGRVPQRRRVASWSAAPPPATPASSHQWRSVCID